MKNKLFLAACGLILAGISAHSAYAAAGRSFNYSCHFNSSGWNTPYHVVGTCNRHQYNEYYFGGKYKFQVTSDLGKKSFSAQVYTGDNSPTLTNSYSQMPYSVMTFTVNKNNTTYQKWVYGALIDVDDISIRFKKSFTATWSYDLSVTVWPFYND